jgi:hypothetical protein
MSKNDSVKVNDKAYQTITIRVGPPEFVNVKVTAENGIFKNGKVYGKDEKLEMEITAAENYAKIGEVEILGGENV